MESDVAETPVADSTDEQAADLTEAATGEPAPPDGHDHLAERLLIEIRDKNREIGQARLDWEQKDATAKAAKKRLEALHEAFEKYLTEATEEMPLFEPPAKPAAAATSPGEDDLSWRPVPLAELGLAPGMLKKLEEAEIVTIGQLSDFVQAGSDLTDIQGIGETKAEAIRNSLTTYWRQRNEAAAREQHGEGSTDDPANAEEAPPDGLHGGGDGAVEPAREG